MCWFYEKEFEATRMGRSLLLAEIVNEDTVICTAHFESLNSSKARAHQMTDTFKLIKDSGVTNAIVVGDFNFDSSWLDEEAVITSNGMRDVVQDFYP